MICCVTGDVESVKFLLYDIGASPWIRDTVHETTALTYAQNCRGNVESMVQIIRKAFWYSVRKRIMLFVRLRLALTGWYVEIALTPPFGSLYLLAKADFTYHRVLSEDLV